MCAPSHRTIDDAEDPRLSDYRFVREKDLSGERAIEGLFVGETLPIVERMLARPGLTRSVLCSTRMASRVRDCINASSSTGVELLIAEDATIEQTAGFHVHRGVLAIGRREPLDRRTPLDSEFMSASLLLVLDGVHNMDNVGAMFRCAAAFGVAGVILSRRSHDPLYRKVIRVSMGFSLTIPYAWSDDLPTTIGDLRARRHTLRVVAADCARDAVDIASLDARSCDDAPQALIVGHEYDGISPEVLAMSTVRARIPIALGVDSLNAALAAGICLHRLTPIKA